MRTVLFLAGAAAAFAGLPGCNANVDKLFCGAAGCDFSDEEWQALSALADLPPPAPDPSNRYVGNAAAEALGHSLYYDTRFSGPSLLTDALKRAVTQGRAPQGQPSNVGCITCHNPARGGVDTSSLPGNVSIGAGWSDTNAPTTFNAAQYAVNFWNGRVDSLWSQAAAASEGALMNGNRLQLAWTLQKYYRAQYAAVFPEYPLPMTADRDDVQALVETEGPRAGQCSLTPLCPLDQGCREVADATTGATACWPIFPLQGKPGTKPGCQPGDGAEPWGDAFDCLPAQDQAAITRVLVNFGKAIAAYEYRLVKGETAFDQWVHDVRDGNETPVSDFSANARLGARLFVGKAACVECHNTPLFSDNGFHNVGVAQSGPGVPTESDCAEGTVCDCSPSSGGGKNCLPWGARDGLAKLRSNGMRRDSVWSDQPQDRSRQRFVEMPLEQVPKGSWRTPSLRSVALTGPYRHNGAQATLEDVVNHYNLGGSPEAPGAPAAMIKPLFLSAEERSALVEFLKTLTGPPPAATLTATPALP
jgi:cytochrome c peroxidase